MHHEIEVRDVEYLRHGNDALLARLFTPRGAGPFPLIVEVHGGAWCRGDRLSDGAINEALARSGVVVVALDFRMPPVAPYPASVADIHYAIRWAKTRAAEFGSRADMVGALGTSSGAHQAMLVAMRPRDPRYAAIPLAPDAEASLRCVVLCWPVIDPLARYHYAKRLKAGGRPYPDVVDRVLPCHDEFWQSEAAMAEGNPVLALERGERAELPPVLYVQGTRDVAHPRPDLDRFVTSTVRPAATSTSRCSRARPRASSGRRRRRRPARRWRGSSSSCTSTWAEPRGADTKEDVDGAEIRGRRGLGAAADGIRASRRRRRGRRR